MSDDPYLVAGSNVLRNLFGITEQQALDRAEANIVSVRSVLLRRNPIKGNFDGNHLKAVHHFLFQDVYDWAGQFRTIELLKRDACTGSSITRFTPPGLIDSELKHQLEALAESDFLKGLSRKKFSLSLAKLFGELNRIHPFREGNGRAQRMFVRQLAAAVGYQLHFEVISRERLVQASILSSHGDFSMMERLMDEITDIERIQAVVKVIDHFKGYGFNWNDHYLSSTTPGQTYTGTFAGSDGTNFFFYDEHNRIMVGNMRDLDVVPKPKDRVTFKAS